MDTTRNGSQAKSGKQNLTHHMLWFDECAILLGKVGSQAVNENRAEKFFSFVTADVGVWFLD